MPKQPNPDLFITPERKRPITGTDPNHDPYWAEKLRSESQAEYAELVERGDGFRRGVDVPVADEAQRRAAQKALEETKAAMKIVRP